jgi:hypothetical protein
VLRTILITLMEKSEPKIIVSGKFLEEEFSFYKLWL